MGAYLPRFDVVLRILVRVLVGFVGILVVLVFIEVVVVDVVIEVKTRHGWYRKNRQDGGSVVGLGLSWAGAAAGVE